MPVFICVYMKEFYDSLPHMLLSLRATIEGSCLLFLKKLDVLLQEVQVSIGNIPFCYSVKVLDPNTAAVCSCSESERRSGRCPLLVSRDSKWEQKSLAGSLRYNLEFRGRVLHSQMREAMGRWSHSLPGHCQSGLIRLREVVLQQSELLSDSQALRLCFSPNHRASSVPEEARAAIEPQCKALLSNNAN